MKMLKYFIASLLLAQLNLQAIMNYDTLNAPFDFNHTELASKRDKVPSRSKKEKNIGLAHLFNFNNFITQTNITAGSSIPFNAPSPVRSGGIFQTSIDTFSIRKSGHYYIHFVADALFPTTGSGVVLELNGLTVGPGTPTTYSDTPLIIQEILPIKIDHCSKEATLRVIVTGLPGTALTFPVGQAASISIIQLTTD